MLLSPNGAPDLESALAAADPLPIQAALNRVTVALADVAAVFRTRRGWFEAGFARLDDYARERLDRTGRWVREMAALGECLQDLPALRDAMLGEDGGPPLGRVAAGLVGRVATTETLPFWVARARAGPVSELRSLVCGRARRWESVAVPVSREVKAAFEESLDLYRAVEGREASAAEFVEALCAEYAAGGGEVDDAAPEAPMPGRPGRGAVNPCDGDAELALRHLVELEDHLQRELMRVAPGASRRAARRRSQAARGLRGLAILSDAFASGRLGQGAALLLGRIEGGWDADRERAWLARAREATLKRLRDEVVREGALRPMKDAAWHASLRREPGRSRSRVIDLLSRAGTATVFLRLRLPGWLASDFRRALDEAGLPELLAEFVRAWDDPDGMPRRRGDEVHVRDGWRCMAPGCTSRRNLESHHVRYRSRGGEDDLENRVCLCRFHHQRGEHGGLMSCRGVAPLGLVWEMGTERYLNERRIRAAC